MHFIAVNLIFIFKRIDPRNFFQQSEKIVSESSIFFQENFCVVSSSSSGTVIPHDFLCHTALISFELTVFPDSSVNSKSFR
jgi:hypothetical protein